MQTCLRMLSPIGILAVVAEDDAIAAIRWVAAAPPEGEPSSPLLIEAARQLTAYFAGRLTRFELPLAPAGSPFEQRVWSAMCDINYGETRRYGELAAAIGSAPRAVGGACGRNPIPIVIPCHRVLARGRLGGYSGEGGLATKRHLLALEGALPEEMPLLRPRRAA